MQSNRIVVMLAADGISGLDISYGKNINTMYLNSHLNSEFVVRPAFLLGASETMWVTFSKGETSTRPLLLAQRQTNDGNNSRQVVDGTESTIEKIPDTGYEYFIDMPDVVLQNVGEWSFSITITELPVDVEYKGQVNATSDLPSSGNAVGDTYWVGGSVNSYYYWNGSAWAVLNIVAVSTSDVGTITVNMSVGGQIGGFATDLDIQVLYNFVLRVINRLSDYLPKIVDGYWWVWNSDSKAYVNSGKVASGLTYQSDITATSAPTSGNTIATTPSHFNRTPIVGEYFMAVVNYVVTGDTYVCLLKATASNRATYEYIGNTRGAKGEKGDTGAQGQKGDTGATGVGIANVKQEVVTGGTQVTITLTNGTSSSFIVYNGTADNITNLEFPHGDAVVTYDNVDGLHIHGNCRITLNGTNYDIPMDVEVPQTAGDGLTEDATSDAKGSVLKVDETVVRTNKANQHIQGSVTIGGNLSVSGTMWTVNSNTLKVKDKLIVVADGNTVTLTSPAGLLAPKYDGTNNGALVFDSTGTAYVGDVVLTANGEIDVAKSDLQPLATRGTLVNGNIVKWNGEKLRLEDTGIAAGDVAKKSDLGKVGNFIYKLNYESATVPTVGQVLTLTNANFSRTPIVGDVFQLMEVVNTKDTYANNMEILTVGDTTCTAKIMSFTDITSGKVTKVTEATPNPQVYAKNADGTQGMKEIKGGNGIIVDAASDNKFLEVKVGDTVNLAANQSLTIHDSVGIAAPADYVKFADDKLTLDASGNTNIAIGAKTEDTYVYDNLGENITVDGAAVGAVADVTNWLPINAYYEITGVPTSSTSGTLPDNISWSYLRNFPEKLRLLFNKEFYQFADNQHTTGTLVFSHVGYEGGQLIIKTITITIATRGWVLTTVKPAEAANFITLRTTSGKLSDADFTKLDNDANSYILLTYSGQQYKLLKNVTSTTDLIYSVVDNEQEYKITILLSDHTWGLQVITLENTANRVAEIKASSADEEYPSAAATYTYGQTVLTAAKSYANTAIANAITTVLNTPV